MIDARGYSCPMPVVMVQQAVKESHPDTVEVLVDSRTCVENVGRFAAQNGYQVDVSDADGDYKLTLHR
jgi:tRNA 2-thiouridine synthesizing protein A